MNKTSCFVPIRIILINDRDAFFENKTTCFVPKPPPLVCEGGAFEGQRSKVKGQRSKVKGLRSKVEGTGFATSHTDPELA